MQIYRGYGLAVRSEVPLTDWQRDDGAWDVDVRMSQVPDALHPVTAYGSQWSHGPQGVLVRVPGVGKFLVRDGREVLVEALPTATAAELAYGFHSAAVGPLLHQRGRLVLHASVIQGATGCIAIAGHSGAGKSTTLLACLGRGFRMVADDIASIAINPVDRSAYVDGGIAAVGAWPDTASWLQLQRDGISEVRPGSQKLKVTNRAAQSGTLALRAVIALHVHHESDVHWQSVTGREKFRVVWSLTRGLRIAAAIDQHHHFNLASDVAATVPVYRLGRPDGAFEALGDVVSRIASVVEP